MNENQYDYNKSGCPKETSVDNSNTNSTTTSPLSIYSPAQRKMIKVSLITTIFALLFILALGETGAVKVILIILVALAAIVYPIGQSEGHSG